MKRRESKTTVTDVVVEVTCDVCGAMNQSSDWSTPGADVEVTVEMSVVRDTGYGSGSGEKLSMDVCPHCFEHVLVPFLQLRGATIRQDRYDY